MDKKLLSYDVKQDGINEVIDEAGSMVMMLREVAWQGREHRLELRNWIIDVDKEMPMKGVSFKTEQGPHNCVEIMVKHGFGNTQKVLTELSLREDFEDALLHTIGKKKIDETKQKEVLVDENDYFIPSRETLGF